MKPDRLEKVVKRLRSDWLATAVAVFIVYCIIWTIWAGSSDFIAEWAGVGGKLDNPGAWGDSFGGFNAFFAGSGSIAVVVTLYLQYKSNLQQRYEQHIQRFESTFFELLKLTRELREELEFRQTERMQAENLKKYSSRQVFHGYEAIKFAFYELRHWILEDKYNHVVLNKKLFGEHFDAVVQERYESRFAPYFRMIYTILKKISKDEIMSSDEKAYYGNILRSQFTSYDAMLLAFNGASKHSNDLAELLIEFRMLKYVPESRGKMLLQSIYPKIAFEARD